jgi:DNA-directed RNA polymerase subunit K/omega
MELDAAERLRKSGINRYEAVIAVSKYARRLNQERQKEKSEDEESDTASDRLPKITSQALRDVLSGKVEFERPSKA